MHHLTDSSPLGAMRAAIDRAVPRGLLSGPDAVFDLSDDSAADRAMRADVFTDLSRGTGDGVVRLGGLHGAKANRTHHRERPGGKPGAAKERAAVKGAVDGCRVGVRPVTSSVSVSTSNQHERGSLFHPVVAIGPVERSYVLSFAVALARFLPARVIGLRLGNGRSHNRAGRSERASKRPKKMPPVMIA
jgi:hypothetical protein